MLDSASCPSSYFRAWRDAFPAVTASATQSIDSSHYRTRVDALSAFTATTTLSVKQQLLTVLVRYRSNHLIIYRLSKVQERDSFLIDI